MVSLLTKEGVALDTQLRKRQDYEEDIKKIEKFTRQTTEEYTCRNKKTKKTRSLLGNVKIMKKKKNVVIRRNIALKKRNNKAYKTMTRY